ncbi:armadillo-like helical domain-containing protein 4 [Cheilinus undulatus]|uniref:armadillo-like helical domain-containing protein 4 n=1 Tax=Cheilinus undulatus TaxID=241271 RepID=UPI001BD4B2F0|nr:armadillo-like helical domain-containing protein 4 [Cheilinus undulatus]XP_041660667.1 armadillo-like helical domain-containing protein 4 [Cheilinus undulatus]
MLMSRTLGCLLLVGLCLCIHGNPVLLPDSPPTQDRLTTVGPTQTPDVKSEPTGTESLIGLALDVGAGGGVGLHGAPVGAVTQTENGDSLDGVSGPRKAGREVQNQMSEGKKVGSTSRMGDALTQKGASEEGDTAVTNDPTGGRKHLDVDLSSTDKGSKDKDGEGLTDPPVSSVQDKNTETGLLSSTETLNPGATIQKLTSYSPIVVSPHTSTLVSIWDQDGATTSSLPAPLLPEIGANPMPKEDGPESVWTEATRLGGVDTVAPLSQDEATEGTMSSEALPLIFEPIEEVASEGVQATVMSLPGSAQPPAAMVTAGMDVDPQLVTVETDSDGPSQAPPLLTPDWTSPWQTSGAELLEPVSSSGTSGSQRQTGSELEEHGERGAVRTPNLQEKLPTVRPSFSSFPRAMTAVTMGTHQPAHKSRSGLEEMESEEEQDEDEDDENSEESVEDESEEDLTESPKTSSTPPPYSLIPPPPVWVQRNQGLMRSWVELIREKAGYVSGMLAPVGIGITGALLIVGALYSIRMIHRKRRNSFKHQRRKVRQQEQPREPGTSRQDQAMLLADSSEDEF